MEKMEINPRVESLGTLEDSGYYTVFILQNIGRYKYSKGALISIGHDLFWKQ